MSDVAEMCGVHTRTVHIWASEGRLKKADEFNPIRRRQVVRFRREDVEAFILAARHAKDQPPEK